MNISIYYLSKKIVLNLKNQLSVNQSFNDLDVMKPKEIIDVFEKFINNQSNNILIFYITEIEFGLNKLKNVFKYIEAAGGLIEQNNSWLFIYRLKHWDLPKGKLDKGESPEEAGIRECEEECGITKLSITKTLAPTYHIYPHKGKYALKKTFWYLMSTQHNGVLVPQIEENIEKVEWLNKSQISEIVKINTYPAIIDVLKNIEP
jgi:8-oxo-dGTP pyrophosphatase MutT (NUDIX family)